MQQYFISRDVFDTNTEEEYVVEVEEYETQAFRFEQAAEAIGWSFASDKYRLKSIFQLKK